MNFTMEGVVAGGAMFEAASVLAVLAGGWAWFRVNQWLVGRKGL